MSLVVCNVAKAAEKGAGITPEIDLRVVASGHVKQLLWRVIILTVLLPATNS